MKIFNAITRNYIEVTEGNGCYLNGNGEELIRLEKWGKSGKKLRPNYCYLNNGEESPVYGMGGSTGMGWGGYVAGYVTEAEWRKLQD